MERPTLADLHAARERLAGVARETPLLTSNTFARLTGREVALKAETLQLTGAFKIRGALNTVAQLGDAERRGGVVTASAGNHGQALAWAARHFGIPAMIFVPENAPMAKVEAARGYGATCELAGEGFDEAHVAARAYEQERGATFVHAFEDPRVIAGQGTLGLELVEQLPPGPATVVIPVGGGGLASGVAIALRALRPEISLVGVQAAACAPLAGMAPTGPDDRRRDRGQAPGRADLVDPARPAGRDRRRRRRGDLRGDRAPARALEARRRGRGGGAGGGAAPRASCRETGRRAPCSRAATSTRRR